MVVNQRTIVKLLPSSEEDLWHIMSSYNVPSVLHAILDFMAQEPEPDHRAIEIVRNAIDKLTERTENHGA